MFAKAELSVYIEKKRISQNGDLKSVQIVRQRTFLP